MNDRWSRLAPLSGLFAAVFFIAAMIVHGSAPAVKHGAQLAQFYDDKGTQQQIASHLVIYAAIFTLLWGAYLWRRLRQGALERSSGPLVAFGGATLGSAGMMVLGGTTISQVIGANDKLPVATIQALESIQSASFSLIAVGLGVNLLGIGVCALRGATVPKKLGIAALVAGIIGISPVFWLGVPLWVLVTVIISIWAWRAEAAKPAATNPVTVPQPGI